MMHIQIIIGSVRMGRIGTQIGEWVYHSLKSKPSYTVELIDLADWYLPWDDEPYLPATGKYTQLHTKKWSEKIAQGNAYLFVFPQYNGGYPASLKNAVDHLYQEWNDKPALLVSYANQGGEKSAAQFAQVLEGVRARPLSTRLEIPLLPLNLDENGRIVNYLSALSIYQQELNQAVDKLLTQ